MRSLLLLGLAALVGVGPALSQTKPEPPRRPVTTRTGPGTKDSTRQAESQLPKIELPEYDITGTLVPGVESAGKGETGGNGALDPLGRGTVRSRDGNLTDQGVWKLGASLSALPGSRMGRVEAGYGSFRNPFLDAWVRPGTEDLELSFRGGLSSTEGHVDHADERRGSFAASMGWKVTRREESLRDAYLRASVSYSGRGYSPYGSTVPDEKRAFNVFAAGLGLTDVALGAVALDGRVLLSSASIAGDQTLRHTRFGLEGSAAWELPEVRLQGGFEGSFSEYVNGTGSGSPNLFRFTLLAARELTEDLSLQLGLSAASYRGSDLAAEGRLFPLASVTWFPGRNIELFIRFEPSVREGSLAGVASENPYLAYSSVLRPEIATTDLSVGTEITLGRPLRVRFVTQLQRFVQYLAFADTSGRRLWETEYSGVTRIFTLRGDLLWQMTEADLLTFTVRGNSTDNSITGTAVPYFPTLVLDGGLAHWFSFGLLLSADVRLLGSRTADVQGNTRLDPAFLASVGLEYSFLPAWRIHARCGNLFGVRYDRWLGYSAAPRYASLSLSFSW